MNLCVSSWHLLVDVCTPPEAKSRQDGAALPSRNGISHPWPLYYHWTQWCPWLGLQETRCDILTSCPSLPILLQQLTPADSFSTKTEECVYYTPKMQCRSWSRVLLFCPKTTAIPVWCACMCHQTLSVHPECSSRTGHKPTQVHPHCTSLLALHNWLPLAIHWSGSGPSNFEDMVKLYSPAHLLHCAKCRGWARHCHVLMRNLNDLHDGEAGRGHKQIR